MSTTNRVVDRNTRMVASIACNARPVGLPNGLAMSRAARRQNSIAARTPAGRREPAKGVGSIALLGGLSSVSLSPMTLKARVRAGRLIVDEPTDLPDGTEIDLLPLDPGDWLDEADKAALHQALRESNADVAAGRLIDVSTILAELRSR